MTIINIDEQLAELTQVREELVKSLEVVDYRIYLLKSYESITNCPMQITHVEFETSVQTIPSLGNGIVSPNSHIPSKGKEEEVTRSLIAHCKTFMEACEILADVNDGILVLNATARELKRAGLSRAKKVGSITATLHSSLKKHPDWEFEGPGVFRKVTQKARAQGEDAQENHNEQRPEAREQGSSDGYSSNLFDTPPCEPHIPAMI